MSVLTPEANIHVAGHAGMVGAAIVRRLRATGHDRLLLRTRAELDLGDPHAVDAFYALHRPQLVFLAAAKVGGIHANSTYPARFIHENLAVQTSVIHSAWTHGVRKLVFLGSSCIYPRLAPQPITEDALLTGPLEPTNEPYAIAKIAGLKMCQAYRKEYGFDAVAAMPTNAYGPGDNYHPQDAHVVAALIRRFDEARRSRVPEVEVWGSGTPLRELLYVDDLADALIRLMDAPTSADVVNIGSGDEYSIADIALHVANAVGYRGTIRFDRTKPDGTPRKLLDSSRMVALGWRATTPLREGLELAYRDWLRADHLRR